MAAVQLVQSNKVEIDSQRYTNIPEVHQQRATFRTLGRTSRTSTTFSHKRTESEFHVMRKIIEMDEIRKANAKKAQQIDARKAQYAVSKYKNLSNSHTVDKSHQPTRRPRSLRRVNSLSRKKTPEPFTLKHVKKISIADFRVAQKIQRHHFIPTCSRKDDPLDLIYNRNSMHCDLFGPGLCPDCLRSEARNDFTKTQDELFPFLDAHPRALVAESKIRSLFNPKYVKSSWQIAGRKDIGWNILRNVCTENDIYNRVKGDSRVTVFYC